MIFPDDHVPVMLKKALFHLLPAPLIVREGELRGVLLNVFSYFMAMNRGLELAVFFYILEISFDF